MFRLTLSLCIVVLLATVVVAEPVRFATLNVYWLYDDDPPHQKWAGQREGYTWKETLATVADAVASINADVLALQEIESQSTLEDLVEALEERGKSYPYFWIGAGTDPFTGQDVAVLSRYPNLTEPIRAYPALRAEFHTDKGYPRLAALQKFMRVDIEISGEPVTIYALHLKSRRGNGITTSGERMAQARLIRRLVRANLEKGRPNIVVMGDFNDGPESDTLREIRGLNDGGSALDIQERKTAGTVRPRAAQQILVQSGHGSDRDPLRQKR
ncbi:MAG: endonuclease/exonuclease/phosphatase family protein [Deltaproteobacteria bacterium]|nr:endonuclease/exonuclease/phosphatase family protein [Deltaproteobacteria bacterium]